MHTLSIFPSLLTFGIFAPFLIRIIVAIFVIQLGRERFRKEYKWTSIFYFISGALIFVGLYTQIAVILAFLVLEWNFHIEYRKNKLPLSNETHILYWMAGVILVSLLFTGPGFLAIDWPL